MNEPAASLKLAVLGAGLIGERHARLIAATPSVELGCIIDPSKPSIELADELSATHFADIEAFLNCKHGCEGVIIATPNETHKRFAISCLEHDLPCLIEKPLAANSEDAGGILDAARKVEAAVLTGHHRRHHAVSRIMKDKIDNGDLGALIAAQLTWMLRKPDAYFEAGAWRVQKGGGPVWINLIHEIDLLRYFLGEVVEVSAMLSNHTRGHAVEDTGVISLRFEGGTVASVILSDTAPSPWHFEGGSGENPNISKTGQGGMRIFGTKGAVEFPSLTHWKHDDESAHWGTPIHANEASDIPSMEGESALAAQLQNFAGVIRGLEKPLVTAFDGFQNVRVVEAVHQSAIGRKSVFLENAN